MGCTHDCSTCGHDCGSEQDFSKKLNEMSSVKKVIGVVSGKGGVGKSLVTSLLAVSMQRLGYRTAILDADITGPSIPQAFGLREKIETLGDVMLPAVSRFGTQVMSINLLLERESDPVVWARPGHCRGGGPVLDRCVLEGCRFYVCRYAPRHRRCPSHRIPVPPRGWHHRGHTPQQLVGMIVEKAVKMAEMMKVPVLGLIENMSTYTCPDCGKQHAIFGESHLDSIAAEHHIPVLARLPIQPALASLMDTGTIELFEGDFMQPAADRLCALLPR